MNAWLSIVGPILALISSVVVAVILGRRGIKSDKIVEQAGIATDKTNSIGQVMAALNSLNDNLQEDNEVLRSRIAVIVSEVKDLRKRVDDVESGSSVLRETIREQAREIASLHAENEALVVENEKLKTRVLELEQAAH